MGRKNNGRLSVLFLFHAKETVGPGKLCNIKDEVDYVKTCFYPITNEVFVTLFDVICLS